MRDSKEVFVMAIVEEAIRKAYEWPPGGRVTFNPQEEIAKQAVYLTLQAVANGMAESLVNKEGK